MHSALSSKRKAALAAEPVNAGFQIAPMIDVVFVIMLFFMAMAGSVRVENELSQQLPARIPVLQDAPIIPYEVMVGVAEAGQVTLNEEALDAPESRQMPGFTATLMRLKQEADSRRQNVLVTIEAEEQASYERVVDVLNALAQARVSTVTFTVGGSE